MFSVQKLWGVSHTNSVRVNLNVNLQSHINSVSVKLKENLQ
jgi:uncharacterized Zn finger protein